MRVLLAKIVERAAFALPNNLVGRGGRPCPHDEMDMVWLNDQVEHLPAHLHACLPDQFGAVLRDRADEDFPPAFRAPDEMVDDQMYPMFVSLIFYLSTVSDLSTSKSRALASPLGLTSRGGAARFRSILVDLRPLEAATVIDVDGLPFREHV